MIIWNISLKRHEIPMYWWPRNTGWFRATMKWYLYDPCRVIWCIINYFSSNLVAALNKTVLALLTSLLLPNHFTLKGFDISHTLSEHWVIVEEALLKLLYWQQNKAIQQAWERQENNPAELSTVSVFWWPLCGKRALFLSFQLCGKMNCSPVGTNLSEFVVMHFI